MLFEATYVAQIHVTDEFSNSILENEDAQSNIFIQMGLQKKGHSYWTYDFNKADGTTLVSGLRSVGGGNAKTQSNTFQEILDFSNTSCLKNNSNFFRM